MESYQINDFTFTYPDRDKPAVFQVSLSIEAGQFVVLCGKSGCGKTTLLRQLKSVLTPHGEKTGEILFEGHPLEMVEHREQSSRIGYVMQEPDNQLVTDKVWHEMAFGLESLGFDNGEIRLRVSEMASFFGIQTWFHKNVTELSGGQKQLLNLAAVMVMQPSVLILDEPTEQLDPIAASDFLDAVKKINRELGTTVILTEHRLEEAIPMADRVIVMDEGRILADCEPGALTGNLKEHDLLNMLPTPMRIHGAVENQLPCPVTVREGRDWLAAMARLRNLDPSLISRDLERKPGEPVLEAKEVWFRYEKDGADILKGLSISVNRGELFAIVGGNGMGKTTALSVFGGLLRPYRGRVLVEGKPIGEFSHQEKFGGLLGMLPQNPQSLFVKKTVSLDLYEMLKEQRLTKEEKKRRMEDVIALCDLKNLTGAHPYDLSGGEKQRAALAKLLLLQPRILFLDEPTKGLDSHFKKRLAEILSNLQEMGTTIIMVSHDIEFCAAYADRCAMLFDGNVTACDTPRRFFRGNRFYTTAAARMARSVLPEVLLAEDVIAALGGKPVKEQPQQLADVKRQPELDKKKKPSAETANSVFSAPIDKEKRRLAKRTVVSAVLALLAVPLTIFFGMYYLEDRKYYFISLLIILEVMLPFVMIFEGRKPQARELVVISVLCAIAVLGRAAFFMLPQFKPVLALIILSGVCFGGETGFLIGAVTGFVSNFFFGQGPWTPWQMFALGITGFLGGVLFQKGWIPRQRIFLCIFGGMAAVFLYGGIMNTSSVLMGQAKPGIAAFLSAYALGLPFDLIHGAATVFFLWLLARPMLEKLERIKRKYGFME